MFTDRIAALHHDLDLLLAEDTVGASCDELLTAVREFEVFKRRLAVADHRFVAELDDRGVAAQLCVPSTGTLLRHLLRITPGEAKARVRAAANLGPRRSLLGEMLPPLFTRVASAQAAGDVSPEHARVVISAIDKLPAAITAEYEAQLEDELVEHALTYDPQDLQKLARRLLDVLDPDGTLTDDADHERRREFLLAKHRDGSATSQTYFAPDLTAIIEAFLDTHAAPTPATDGSADVRSAGQRNYDAIHAGFTHLMTCGPTSPDGKPSRPAGTLILTMTADQFQSGQGYVNTPHGDLITVPKALTLVGQSMSVVFDPHGGILSYGRTKRLVPPDLRLALTARDRGCTFPGCTRPPAWTQAHHFQEWANDGPTSTNNCGLVCGHHHRHFQQRGWTSHIINNRPHWTPPKWIDPRQVPRRNTAHDPPMRT